MADYYLNEVTELIQDLIDPINEELNGSLEFYLSDIDHSISGAILNVNAKIELNSIENPWMWKFLVWGNDYKRYINNRKDMKRYKEGKKEAQELNEQEEMIHLEYASVVYTFENELTDIINSIAFKRWGIEAARERGDEYYLVDAKSAIGGTYSNDSVFTIYISFSFAPLPKAIRI